MCGEALWKCVPKITAYSSIRHSHIKSAILESHTKYPSMHTYCSRCTCPITSCDSDIIAAISSENDEIWIIKITMKFPFKLFH